MGRQSYELASTCNGQPSLPKLLPRHDRQNTRVTAIKIPSLAPFLHQGSGYQGPVAPAPTFVSTNSLYSTLEVSTVPGMQLSLGPVTMPSSFTWKRACTTCFSSARYSGRALMALYLDGQARGPGAGRGEPFRPVLRARVNGLVPGAASTGAGKAGTGRGEPCMPKGAEARHQPYKRKGMLSSAQRCGCSQGFSAARIAQCCIKSPGAQESAGHRSHMPHCARCRSPLCAREVDGRDEQATLDDHGKVDDALHRAVIQLKAGNGA